ncbi:MAG: protein kinase [Pyrinomonadaceae bacterium]|nr:protein kinase [Pyrinomonadaceae bacterium]
MKKCPTCGETYFKDITLCPADGSALMKTGDSLLGQTLAGKYRIEERLSEGGMGTVYRATHVLMEKAVALKVLHPSLAADENIVARFTREAKAASRLSHPHAISVTDFGESDNGIVFLVMEYLRGRTLKQVIRQEGPLPLGRVVEIARQVSGALAAAHAEGVVHRDLKSDNIMLEEISAGSDWAKVLDFGIAKIQQPDNDDPELTAPNLIIGTPQYMSPEQCSKTSGIDYRSDIYSFGVIVFEMLTGHVPFTGDSATTIMLKHLQEPPPSVLDERSDLPPAVGQAVARALSKRREDRPQSAGELAEALARAADTPGGAQAGALAAGGATGAHDLPVADTNRIVVPTASQDSRPTAYDNEEDEDESTIVNSSPAGTRPVDVGGVRHVPPPAAAVARLNPWKIMIPAALLVLVVLGVFYVTQRDSQPAADESGAPLASDPNAQAVEPLAAPTGAAERDITPGSTASPSPAPTSNATTGNGSSSSGSTVGDPLASPSDISNDNSNAAANDNTARNDNATDEPEPSPTTAPSNDNQRRTPTPTPADDGEDPPPPTPTPRRLPTPARQSPLPLPSLPPPSGARTPDN